MNPQEMKFTLKTPMILFGILMFLINRFADSNLNLPVGDLFLPFLTLAFVVREKGLPGFIKSPGLILVMLLLVWITTSNIVNGITFLGQIRNTYAVATLFIPIMLFTLTKNRSDLIAYFIGITLGFALYFVTLAGIDMAHGEIARELRGEQPTPVVALALYVMFRDRMSKSLQFLILGLVAATLAVAITIEARGAILSLMIAVAVYLAARVSPWPRVTIPALVVLGLMAHFISGNYVGSSFDTAISSGNDTVSDLERAYAIDYSRMVISQFPWFGNSPQGYSINFTDFFNNIAGFSEEGDKIASPHNTFLEYGVFFGYPAAYLFMLIVARFVFAGTTSKKHARTLTVALCAAGIIRLGAFYGFSGNPRMEWFALMFTLLYAYKNQQTEAPVITEEMPPKSAVKLTPAQQRAAAVAAARKASARAS